MSKPTTQKKLSIQYQFDEKGKVSFINPSCEEMPLKLFTQILKAIGIVEYEYNKTK
ncbi:MAG: hypothetical protein RR346_03815 [Bacteroidales bacterium]